MPLSRQPTQTQNAMASQYGVENNTAGGKAALRAKGNVGARAPLGNIANKVSIQTRAQTKKAVKQAPPQATKKVEKEPVQLLPKSPAPMDISGNEFTLEKHVQHIDIDREDKDNPQLVSEYVNEIYSYMRLLEQKFAVEQQYLEGKDLNGKMRGILVDWLVQVHLRFHLLQETLYLTVCILDRFLQVEEISRKKLQLVGVTAMLIASKYEEMYAPEVGDFVYITDNAYSKENIREMERVILKALDFSLGKPLPLHFLRRNSKAGEIDSMKHTLAKYLMELTIVEYDMVHIPPSEIAAAALCLSMKVMGNLPWSTTLEHYSKYTEAQLQPVMKKMVKLVMKANTGKLTAVHTKYKSSKFMRISIMPELKSISNIFEDEAEEE